MAVHRWQHVVFDDDGLNVEFEFAGKNIWAVSLEALSSFCSGCSLVALLRRGYRFHPASIQQKSYYELLPQHH